ncbi:YcxB family protein [Altererythrobacter sp. CAU 1778]
MGEAVFFIAEDEVVEAARFTSMKRLFSRPLLPLLIGLLVVLAVAAISVGKGQVMLFAIAAALALPIAFAVTLWWVVPWQARRHYRQTAALRDEIALRWDDEGVRMASARGNSRLAWSDFHAFADTASLLILYQSEMLYSMFPKRAFAAGEIEEMKRRARRAGLREI